MRFIPGGTSPATVPGDELSLDRMSANWRALASVFDARRQVVSDVEVDGFAQADRLRASMCRARTNKNRNDQIIFKFLSEARTG